MAKNLHFFFTRSMSDFFLFLYSGLIYIWCFYCLNALNLDLIGCCCCSDFYCSCSLSFLFTNLYIKFNIFLILLVYGRNLVVILSLFFGVVFLSRFKPTMSGAHAYPSMEESLLQLNYTIQLKDGIKHMETCFN